MRSSRGVRRRCPVGARIPEYFYKKTGAKGGDGTGKNNRAERKKGASGVKSSWKSGEGRSSRKDNGKVDLARVARTRKKGSSIYVKNESASGGMLVSWRTTWKQIAGVRTRGPSSPTNTSHKSWRIHRSPLVRNNCYARDTRATTAFRFLHYPAVELLLRFRAVPAAYSPRERLRPFLIAPRSTYGTS